MAVLNYKYRLYPTPDQAKHLSRTMMFIWRGWAQMVRFTRQAQWRMRHSRCSDIRRDLAGFLLTKKMTGQRAAKLNREIAAGKTREQALKDLNRENLDTAWRNYKASKLAMQYALERASANKQKTVGSLWGSCWKQLQDKFTTAWKACWEGIREAPRKGDPSRATWLEVQVLEGRSPLLHNRPQGAYRENWIQVPSLFRSRIQKRADKSFTQLRLIQHRPLPMGAVVKNFKIVRSSNKQTAEWHVVLAIDAPDDVVAKDYPTTGAACGIDPGRKTALTLAGTDVTQPGQGGQEFGPGAPLQKALRKLRRLQRKLDRQRRANNPHCFDEKGVWIKGERLTNISKNMEETAAAIAQTHARVADVRRSYYHLAVDEILSRYDTVCVGNWTDGTPQAKGRAKKARREAFQVDGTKRAKGQAARQRTANRHDRDNALGVFRQILTEKAKRSKTTKAVVSVKEKNTTRQCVQCGALAGPTGLKGLSKRSWSCSACGCQHQRDRGAAWNILQAGLQQVRAEAVSQAAAQAVTGGSQKSSVARTRVKREGRVVTGRSRPGREVRKAPITRLQSDRAFQVSADAKLTARAGEVRAEPQLVPEQVVVPTAASLSAAKNRRAGDVRADGLKSPPESDP